MESNCFEIKDMKTGARIKQTAMVPFSNDRLLITDNLIAETFCKQLIDELLHQEGKRFKRSLRIVLQVCDPKFSETTKVEQMIYLDFACFVGARCYWFCPHQRLLTDDEVLTLTK
jgi:hypothetical protein